MIPVVVDNWVASHTDEPFNLLNRCSDLLVSNGCRIELFQTCTLGQILPLNLLRIKLVNKVFILGNRDRTHLINNTPPSIQK